MMPGQSSSSAPRYALGFAFENGLTCIVTVRPALRRIRSTRLTPVNSEALPVSSCRMTSFVVRSAKRFHQVLAVDAVEVGEVVVVPDAHLVRPDLVGRLVHRVGCLLQEVRRLVDLRRERPDDQVAVADRLVELDRRRELVALQFAERVVEPARLQLGRVEVLPPLRARLAERVLELDAVEPDRGERVERARNVGGELFPHAPELRADRESSSTRRRPDAGSAGTRRADAAAVPPSFRMSRRVGCLCMDSVLSVARILRSTSLLRASGWRAHSAAPCLTDQRCKYLILT